MEKEGFGEVLKAFRKRRKLTQHDLAERLQKHINTIGHWERGMYLPDTKGMVLEIARVLGLHDSDTDKLLEASLTALTAYWNVPYQRNLFFTGRMDILQDMQRHLAAGEDPAQPRLYALKGLGGIGKTQTAVEYAYQFGKDYSAVLWTGAETADTLLSGFVALASVLDLPEKHEEDQTQVVSAVKSWLTKHKGWLLILDNVEDANVIKEYLPAFRAGSVLLTTRLQAVRSLALQRDVPKMTPEESTSFLLRRSGLHDLQQGIEHASQIDLDAARAIAEALDGLPLALDQAGAYMEETGCSLLDYLHLFRRQQVKLLTNRRPDADHPLSVVRTYALALERIGAAAAEILGFCSFLASEAIPEELIAAGAAHLGPLLQPVAASPLALNEAFKELLRYGLISRHPRTKTLSMHRLVQSVCRAQLEDAACVAWIKRTVAVLTDAFPLQDSQNSAVWTQCERFIAHIQQCALNIRAWELSFLEAGTLFERAGLYLHLRGRSADAKDLLELALALYEHHLKPDDSALAQCLNTLALVYREQHNYDKTRELLERAFAICEQQPAPKNMLLLAKVFANRGQLHLYQRNYAAAEHDVQQALAIQESVLGEKHPETAVSLNDLALIYVAQNKHGEADALYLRVLSLYEATLPSEHPDLSDVLYNLGISYTNQHRYAEAEALFQRALSIDEQIFGALHPRIASDLNDLALAYKRQGKYIEAAPLYQQALSINEQVLHAEHPSLATSFNNLGMLYYAQGNFAEAEPLLQRALAIRASVLAADHPETAKSYYNVGKLYFDQGRYAEAEPYCQQALAIYERILPPTHTERVQCLQTVTELAAAV